ncbi:LysR family transcriptional regulator [uncultured Mailhella sp.]|uniref:LysR family transcriptional regulator n=1 Tax=uncultured Mailhella sp. TaxID=1981031 RepID=UPI0025E3555F|nr:LysR family transcriptional regulator [uncultured Mailhella sp.]
MKFNQLQYLLEVARQHSFNRAAEALHTTPSNIMSALNRLEEELGVSLFIRSSRGVSLTANGERICADASSVMAMHDRWTGGSGGSRRESVVDISAIPVIYHAVAPGIVEAVLEEVPGVMCRVHERLVWEINEDLPFLGGGLALTYTDNADVENDIFKLSRNWNVKVTLLAGDRWKIFVGQDHPLAERGHLETGELAQYPACFSMAPVVSNTFYGELYREDALFVQNPAHMLRAVARGRHWCILPGLFGESVHAQTGCLVPLDIDGLDTGLKYYMLSPEEDAMSEHLKLVASCIVSCFSRIGRRKRA